MTGKYMQLEKYLAGLPQSTQEISLTFEQVERILNANLPKSAHLHRAWWANERDGRHVHAQAWLNAGWKVESVDQSKKWVRFQRT